MSRLSRNMHYLLNDDVINSLFRKKIFTTIQFIQAETKHLTTITGVTYKNILLLKRHIINKKSAVKQNGLEYNIQITNSTIIPTGVKNIDGLLEGGLITGSIYEFCGLSACGKTQLCLTLAKNVAKCMEHSIYYLDTKGDFNSKRIKLMLEMDELTDMNIGKTMSKILVKHITGKYELINALYAIKTEIENGLKIRLLIIDSLPSLFCESSDIAKGNGILNIAVNLIRYLTVKYYVTFVITNMLTTWYDGNFTKMGILKEKIGCGRYWLSVPNTRLKIVKAQKKSEELYTVFIWKTNRLSRTTTCNRLPSITC